MLAEMEISTSKLSQIGEYQHKMKSKCMMVQTLDSLLPVFFKKQVLKLNQNNSHKLKKSSKVTGPLYQKAFQKLNPKIS
jgi:type II secretory ATPase GspE/PulE/Tfp pilus assembly ATPase PilB-like protein